MSKIVQAVNAMISRPQLLTNVIPGEEGEIFFLYKKNHKWSMINRDDGTYSLWYYPTESSLENLANMPPHVWNESNIPMIHYSDKEIATKEAKQSFAELFSIIKENLYGMNAKLDDIIGDVDL